MTIADLRAPRAVAVLAACALLSGCTDWAMYDVDVASGKVPAFATMRRNVIPDPYGMVRLPAEGSVPASSPLGDVPAPFGQEELESVAGTLSNPLRPTPNVLARGRQKYLDNCAVCHGPNGEGTGPVIGPNKFPYALPLGAGSPAAGRSDGYIYAVIAAGRNMMPAYGKRVTHTDRWAIVSYMRQLQGGGSPRALPTVAAPADAPAAASAPAAAADTPAAPPADSTP